MRENIGTRARIQEVALELFTEQGYEATSLREIAECLGVTKAALYYHFKTKEDIVASMVQDRIAAIQELIEWGRGRPCTLQTRRELLERYADELHAGRHHEIMRFFERNQTALRGHPKGEEMRDRMLDLLDLLKDPDAPLTAQLKSSLAIFALHATWFIFRDPDVTDDERKRAALEVALELVGAPLPASPAPDPASPASPASATPRPASPAAASSAAASPRS
jgi:AcrR family transcriptional regulator